MNWRDILVVTLPIIAVIATCFLVTNSGGDEDK